MFEYIGDKRKFNNGLGTITLIKGVQVLDNNIILKTNPDLFKKIENKIKKEK